MMNRQQLEQRYLEFLRQKSCPPPALFDVVNFTDPEFGEYKDAMLAQLMLELLQDFSRAGEISGQLKNIERYQKASLIDRVRSQPRFGASLVKFISQPAEDAFKFLLYARRLRVDSDSVFAGEAPTGQVFAILDPTTSGLALVNSATNTMLSNVLRIISLDREFIQQMAKHSAFERSARDTEFLNGIELNDRGKTVSLLAEVLFRFSHLKMNDCNEAIEQILGHRYWHPTQVVLMPLIETGIAFLICHEFGHVACGHTESTADTELEADRMAVRLLRLMRGEVFRRVIEEDMLGVNRLISYEIDYIETAASLLFTLQQVSERADRQVNPGIPESAYPPAESRIREVTDRTKGSVLFGMTEFDPELAEHIDMIDKLGSSSMNPDSPFVVSDTSFLEILSLWLRANADQITEHLSERMRFEAEQDVDW